MKKLYSLFMVAIIALLSFQASAYSITLTFDNPSAIGSLIVYSDYSKAEIQRQYAPAATVVVDYDDNSKILDVVAADGYALSSCVFTTPTSSNNYFQNSYKGNHDVYLSSGYSGATYTYTTVNMDQQRTNTATVIVNGDISKVALQFSGTYLYANLVEGTNTVKFMDSENTFTIGPKSYDQTLYSVLLNDVEQNKPYEYSTSWTLSVSNGDVITINADFPEVPCAVAFEFCNDGTQDYITAVYLNQQPVENWQDGFTANGGDNLYFTVDSNKYKLIDFQVNNETKNLNGSYNTTVDGDALEFYFNVEAYGMCTAHVTVDNPDIIQYRVGYSDPYQAAPSASFDIEISEAIASYTPVYFMLNNDSYYVASIVAGDYALRKNYDGSYSTNITDGMNIVITTAEIVRDKVAYFYFHNPDAATDYSNSLYGYYFQSAFNSNITLQQGYNELIFGDVDNPYKFQVNGNLEYVEPKVWYYYNGEIKTHTDTYNAIWNHAYNDKDVIKVYIASEEPTPYALNFTVYDDTAMPEIIYDYVVSAAPKAAATAILDDEAGELYNDAVLPGTHVIIKPQDGMTVSRNDEMLEADEDGNYSFDANEDSNIQIRNITTGIENVIASPINNRVYNLQGIEVKADNLSKGVYIINGKKTYVK